MGSRARKTDRNIPLNPPARAPLPASQASPPRSDRCSSGWARSPAQRLQQTRGGACSGGGRQPPKPRVHPGDLGDLRLPHPPAHVRVVARARRPEPEHNRGADGRHRAGRARHVHPPVAAPPPHCGRRSAPPPRGRQMRMVIDGTSAGTREGRPSKCLSCNGRDRTTGSDGRYPVFAVTYGNNHSYLAVSARCAASANDGITALSPAAVSTFAGTSPSPLASMRQGADVVRGGAR